MSFDILSGKLLFSSCAAAKPPSRKLITLLAAGASPSTPSRPRSSSSSSLRPRRVRTVPSSPTKQAPGPACRSTSGTVKKRGPRSKVEGEQGVGGERGGECAPSTEEASISVGTPYQNGDPLGRKELGRCVVEWLRQGMRSMASKLAAAELEGDLAAAALALEWGSAEGRLGFVIQAQPYLSAIPMPQGLEALCLKACTQYPTLFDHFQRELRDVLLGYQNQGLISEWRGTQSWRILKEMANSSQHRAAVRRTSSQPKAVHSSIGISLKKVRLMQARIEEFVRHMSDLLQVERDVELEFTQEELNAIPVLDDDSEPPKPVEYLVSHGQAQQEQCDTICNLNVISSSTGLGGLQLVLFRVEGGHKLPPTTLSPGDMVCVRTCNSRGEGATSCKQGIVYNFGEDGCSITVALESRHGDATFSRLFGKSVRIDRIQGLADALTYEANWITRCPLLLLDTRMPYGALNIGCKEHLDPAGTGSFYNEGEADIVTQQVLNLVHCGVSPTAIVVQSPYIAQVQLLREKLERYPKLSVVEVSTIDSFQGREADAVIISMVRSNPLGAVGFLGDSRRINVAITRACKHVTVVCDTSTICHSTFLARLLRHIRRYGQVKHVAPGSLDGVSGLGFSQPTLPSIS
ncbi:unnamed protein product [Urochloa humidicola]